jgi:hypothetical protein
MGAGAGLVRSSEQQRNAICLAAAQRYRIPDRTSDELPRYPQARLTAH